MKTYGLVRLSQDPQIHKMDNGKIVARFSVAADREYKKEGEQNVDFFNCVAFGHTAEFIEKYISKGRRIFIEATPRSDKYTNKEGRTVYSQVFVVNKVEFADSKPQNKQETPQTEQPQTVPAEGFMNVPEGLEEELPFN